MIMKGYIPISRSLFDHPFWKEERTFSKAEAWIDLIQSVRFEASSVIVGGKLIDLQKGEMVAARRFLEKRWGWGSTRVTTYLKLLEKVGMISLRPNQGQTVLTLCKYNEFNGEQTITKPQPNHSQTTAKPKEKKGNKENKVNTSVDAPAIAWTSTDGWSGISEKDLADWREAYPACNIDRQLASMNQWLLSNPSKAKKKQWRRFITNWMNRTQERGGDMASAISNKESGSPTTGEIKIGGRTGFIHSAAELKLDDDDE